MASPGTHHGHELIAARLLIVSGPVDRDLLKQWLGTGYERPGNLARIRAVILTQRRTRKFKLRREGDAHPPGVPAGMAWSLNGG